MKFFRRLKKYVLHILYKYQSNEKHSRSYEIGLSHIPCLYEKWYAAAKKNKAIYYMNIAAVRDNHLDAQYQLAHLYECLKSPNYKEAVKWYTVAAKRGHNKAQVMLGKMYYFGHGVEKNLHEAEKWLNLSLKREYSLQAHQILYWLYQDQGMKEMSAYHFKQLVKINRQKKTQEN